MKERRAARRLAVDVLYESEIRDSLPTEALAARQRSGWVVPTSDDLNGLVNEGEVPSEQAVGYAGRLVEGVQTHHADIDALIVRYADRWAIDRMPVIDRTLLRIGVFEMLWEKDVPVAVAINEAVELAKQLSTEDSGKFINGLLGRIAEVAGPSPEDRTNL